MTGTSATNMCRALARAALRIAGSTCLVLAIVLGVLTWRSYSIAQVRAGMGAAPATTFGEFFATPILVATAGAWLLVLDAVLLRRWLAPATGRGCADCGYDLRGIRGGVCPECGATLQPEPPGRS